MIPKLPYDAFLRIVKQNVDVDHVFLLGAGASVSSGIQSTSECIWEWKREIFVTKNLGFSKQYKDYNSIDVRETIQKWLDNEGCYPPQNDPSEYSFYVEKAYPIAEVRRRYFENRFRGKEPSIGYKILCIMVQAGMVRLVFTTNFDGLVVKAAHQTEITPIDISLDTADRIYHPSSKNELLCVELHGDYKYGQLKNTDKELDTQLGVFEKALTHHLCDKHLIVLGYSGRDNSLMEALKNAYKERGSGILFWCGYKDEMSLEVEKLLKEINEKCRKAYFVSTAGFDKTLTDLARHCYENNEEIQKKLGQAFQIKNIDTGIGKDEKEIKVNSIAEEISTAFKRVPVEVIPDELVKDTTKIVVRDWNYHPNAAELVIASIVGTWNENSAPDRAIISQLACEEYSDWITKLRDVLQQPESPIVLKNGIWSVKDRKKLWQSLGTRIFDANLDLFRQCVVTVLTEHDPKFELPKEDRFAASIHGKVLRYSHQLRKGLAESLALLGCFSTALTNCSLNKAENIAVLAVRDIFNDADWVLWASLSDLLPLIAEAAPDEFLRAVEDALQQKPCPFDNIFAQEGSGVTGWNYLTGLLWALETLAWEEDSLVRVSVILGELAARDPGGNWANRPSNSLSTILLPWHPQTMATIDKRKVTIQTLAKELPDVAWKLLLSLLPNQHKMTMGSHKPTWRESIPREWTGNVSNKEYWEQVFIYAEFTVEKAKEDIGRLNELIDHLDNLPQPSFDKVLEHLSSEDISSKPEDERLALWAGLTEFASKHRRFSDAKWALSSEIVSKIEGVAAKLTPTNPLNLHRRLFSGRDLDLYEEKGNWKEQRQKIEERRQQAIKDILVYGEMNAVIRFAESVESPYHVGHSLGIIAEAKIDERILPALLETDNKKLAQFTSGYVWSRQYSNGWAWVDGLNRSGWSVTQIGQFLSYMPFTEEAWNRATACLGESEREYWSRTSANPYHTDGDIGAAIDKLIEYVRPHAAINCLHRMLYDKRPLDKSRSVKALLAAESSAEPSYTIDAYNIVDIIKALQDDPDTDPKDLFQVEWAYLPLLEGYCGASPKLLENRLASDPVCFCEVIRLIYRSKKEDKSDKEPSEQDKSIATKAGGLLDEWRTPPGTQPDGAFSQERFTQWLEYTKEACAESGHLEVALNHVGQVLFYCPPDPQGLWIDQTAADALNSKNAEEMRKGFRLEVFNSREAHWVDPTGKPERELAEQYRQKADEVENAGHQRFAVTLRSLAESYDRDADQIINEYTMDGED